MTDPTPQTPAPASAERVVLVSEATLRAAGWRTLREWHEEGAGYGLAEMFFRFNGINPDEWAPPALVAAHPAPAPASSPSADTRRMDWLEQQVVNVREPQTYGSHDLFWASPVREDADTPAEPSDLRARIDAVLPAAPPAPSPSVSRAEVEALRDAARCNAIEALEDGDMEAHGIHARYDGHLSALLAQHPTTPAGAGAEAEPTERTLDSVRGLLMWYGGGADKTVGSLLFQIRYSGDPVVIQDVVRDLAPTTHVTKAMFADILWRTMHAAQAQAEGGEAL